MSRKIARNVAPDPKHIQELKPQLFTRLPLELLHEIIDYFSDREKGWVLTAFMATNQCLRAFALPLFFKAMHINRPALFRQLVSFLDESPPEFYSYIQSLKIHLAFADMTTFRQSSIEALAKFSSLRIFEANFVQCTQKLLDALPSHLQELDICWHGRADFPDIHRFTNLRSFRMSSVERRLNRVIPRLYEHEPITLPHLTTLVICLVSHACLSNIVHQYRLPNLRVLKFDHAVARPRAVYQFIDQHPSLLEVNVAFQAFGTPRLYPIIQVMGGTDTWKGLSVDTMDTFATRQPEIPVVPWGSVLVQELAFTRVPIDSPETDQLHYIRDLALMTEDTAAWQLGSDFMNLMTLGGKVPLFSQVETLTVQAIDDWSRYLSFSAFMLDLAKNVKEWRHLKHLTIHSHSAAPFRCWGSDFKRDPPAEVLPYLRADTPLLITQPPISSVTGAPLTIQHILDAFRPINVSQEIIQQLGSELQRQIVTIAGAEWDSVPFNKVYLAPAWERVNENTFSAAVLHLAACCPTLQSFDWYLPVPKDPFTQGPKWNWTITRKGHETSVRSNFCWRSRRPLSITVGSELERIIEPPCFSR